MPEQQERKLATMGELRFKKTDLLKKIKENRAEHHKIFLEASDGYQKMLIAKLQVMHEEAKAGVLIDTRILLVRPTDQTKDYDRAIAMLEMSLDDEITLDQTEFSNYVMDEWSWSQQFLTSNAGYSESAMSKLSGGYKKH